MYETEAKLAEKGEEILLVTEELAQTEAMEAEQYEAMKKRIVVMYENGTGGMLAKLEAASMCVCCGIPMIISNGANPEILYDIMENNYKGTFFLAKK